MKRKHGQTGTCDPTNVGVKPLHLPRRHSHPTSGEKPRTKDKECYRRLFNLTTWAVIEIQINTFLEVRQKVSPECQGVGVVATCSAGERGLGTVVNTYRQKNIIGRIPNTLPRPRKTFILVGSVAGTLLPLNRRRPLHGSG